MPSLAIDKGFITDLAKMEKPVAKRVAEVFDEFSRGGPGGLYDALMDFDQHRRELAYYTAVLPRLIKDEAKSGDVVVLLGAGDITSWAYALPAQLETLA